MKKVAHYLEAKLRYQRYLAETLESALEVAYKPNSKEALARRDEAEKNLSIRMAHQFSLHSNRYWQRLYASAKELTASSKLLGNSSDTLARLEDKFRNHATTCIGELTKFTIEELPNTDVVIWGEDQWEISCAGSEVLSGARLMEHQIPIRPQIWFCEDDKFGSLDMIGNRTGTVISRGIEAIIIFPMRYSLEGEFIAENSIPTTPHMTTCFLGILARNGKSLDLVWAPLVSHDVRTENLKSYEPISGNVDPEHGTYVPFATTRTPDDPGEVLLDEHGSILQLPADGLTLAVAAGLLYMAEPWVEVEKSRESVRGVGKKGAKPQEHRSTVIRTKLRKGLRRVSQNPDPKGVKYTCQWLVRPHFRTYTKPLKSGTCVIRIPPYIKGPEDAPFKVKERIFEVSR